MRNIIALSLFTLLACSAALVAQDAEGSLLGRLEAETRALAETAEGTLVMVSTGDAADAGFDPRLLDYAEWNKRQIIAAHARRGVRSEAALVGTPPRVVVPYAAVGKAVKVTVHLADGREVEAKLLDADAELGIAVFALPDDVGGVRGLRPAADWSELRDGSLAVVAGGTGRGLTGLSLLRAPDARLGRLDAAEGPSGAALVGVKGTLLGLRSTARVVDTTSCQACHATSRQVVPFTQPAGGITQRDAALWLAQGVYTTAASIGQDPSPHFVPGPLIHRVLSDIDAHGRIRHGYLGVVLGDAAGEGVRMTAVLSGSPAEAAGLKTGQRIVRVDGVPSATSAAVSRILALKRPGEKTVLGVVTGKEDVTDVAVTLADRTEAQKDLVNAETVGLECVELGRDLRTYLGLDDDAGGVVVQNVRAGSPAARAGLRRGDLIQWGGGGPVANLEELHAALASADGTVELRALRAGRDLTFKLPLKTGR